MSSINPKNSSIKQAIILAAAMLAVFCLIASMMIAVTHHKTAPIIEKNQHEFLMQSLAAVMPINSYDNDLITDSYTVNHSLLSTEDAVVYLAFQNSKPTGAIISAVAANGYNGKIKLIVGVNYAGEIYGVRVVEHKETPGLGDPIEIKRSNWIEQFSDKSLAQPEIQNWAVKKDGGQFDQLTGATITPRAVVAAVKNALVFYQDQRDMLFNLADENKTVAQNNE